MIEKEMKTVDTSVVFAVFFVCYIGFKAAII